MNLFMPVITNESNNKISVTGEMFKIFHRCVPLSSLLSILEIMNGYFFPGIFFSNITNLFILLEGKTPGKFWFKSSLFISLNTFSVSKLDIACDIVLVKSFTNQINPFIYKVIINASVKHSFYLFISHFVFNVYIGSWNTVYGIVYQHFT